MTSHDHRYSRVLGIDPSRRGFGFVVLEGGNRLVDWGVAQVWGKGAKPFLARVESLIELYSPSLIVLEEPGSRRRSQVSIRRIGFAAVYARSRGIVVSTVSRRSVMSSFEPQGATKHAVAVALCELFPELASRLPPKRKPWMSEDERMNIFDALAFTVVALRGK